MTLCHTQTAPDTLIRVYYCYIHFFINRYGTIWANCYTITQSEAAIRTFFISAKKFGCGVACFYTGVIANHTGISIAANHCLFIYFRRIHFDTQCFFQPLKHPWLLQHSSAGIGKKNILILCQCLGICKASRIPTGAAVDTGKMS